MSLITKRPAAMRPDRHFHDVLDYLIRNWRGPNTEYFAYDILTAIGPLGLTELQATLLRLGHDQVLKHKWTLQASTGRLDISHADLSKLLSQNIYRNPETGEVISNAALKLSLSYEPGAALNQLLLFAEVPALIAGPSAA